MNMRTFSKQHKGKIVLLNYLKLGTSAVVIEMCVIFFYILFLDVNAKNYSKGFILHPTI